MIYINGQHIRSFTKDNKIYYAMRDIGKAYGFNKVSDIYKTISSLEKTQVRIVHANGGNAFANVVTAKGMLDYLTIANPVLVPSFSEAVRDFERHSEPVATQPTYPNTKPVTRLEGLYHVVTFEGTSIRCMTDSHSVMVSILDVCNAIGLGYYNQQNKLATKPWSRKLFAWKPEYENGQGSLALVDVKILSRWLQGIKRHKSSKDVLERLDHYKIFLEPFIQDALASEEAPPTQPKQELEKAETTQPEPMTFVETTDMNIMGFDFDGHPVRVTMQENEPWFVLSDVCKVLGLKNASQAATKIKAMEKSTIILNESGVRPHKHLLVNESGLYRVIFRSEKKEAEKFQDWVIQDVLPTLRKTGSYSLIPKETTPEKSLAVHRNESILSTLLGESSIVQFVSNGFQTLSLGMLEIKSGIENLFRTEVGNLKTSLNESMDNKIKESQKEMTESFREELSHIEALLKEVLEGKVSTEILPANKDRVSYNVVEEVLANDSLETTLNNAIAKRLGIEGMSSTEMRKNFQEVSQAAAIEYGKKQNWDLKKIYTEHSRGYLKAIQNHKGKWTPEIYLKAMNRLLEIFPTEANSKV